MSEFFELRFDSPGTMRVKMTPELRELWNTVQFHEDGSSILLEDAWCALLDYLRYPIEDHFMDNLGVEHAKVVRT